MTIEELIAKLNRAVEQDRVSLEDEVLLRDHRVADEDMDGDNGYSVVEEVLIVPGNGVFLLPWTD